jgi:hypothetical protein
MYFMGKCNNLIAILKPPVKEKPADLTVFVFSLTKGCLYLLRKGHKSELFLVIFGMIQILFR